MHNTYYLGNNKKTSLELANLVKKGQKKATTYLHCLCKKKDFPKIGEISSLTDFDGNFQCNVKTKNFEILPFNKITEEHAKKEGEGNCSLEYWFKIHKEFFKKELKEKNLEFFEEMLVIFEEFEVVNMVQKAKKEAFTN